MSKSEIDLYNDSIYPPSEEANRSEANSQSNIVAHDKPSNPLECDICNKTFSRKSYLLKHRNSHTANEQYLCHHCGKVYLIKESLTIHLEMHMSKKDLQCNVCHKMFTRRSRLLLHKNSHTANAQFKCEYCDKVYLLQDSLRQHKQIHRNKDDLSCDKQFKCEYCDKVYLLQDSLRQHKQIHRNKDDLNCDKQFKCEYCDKVYLRRANVREHVRTKHKNKYNLNCDICNKEFAWKTSLLSHRKSHTANKQYVCHHCNKVFLLKNSLRAHLQTHVERSLQCVICQKRFSKRCLLLSHKSLHTAEKQLKCQYCDKVYLIPKSLKMHLYRNNINKHGLDCAICHKKFNQKCQLLSHVNREHREPFICDKCGKVYLSERKLKAHIKAIHVNKRSHAGKKGYKCELCDKAYLHTTIYGLYRHHLETHGHIVPIAPEPPLEKEDFKEEIEIHENDLSTDPCKREHFAEEGK